MAGHERRGRAIGQAPSRTAAATFFSRSTPDPSLFSFPTFCGTLNQLAAALRSGQVEPQDVPLLVLTRDLLGRIAGERLTPQEHAEVLPALAGVIALKAQLLLPKPAAALSVDDHGEDGGDWEVAQGVEALAELGALVSLLLQRRTERAGLIAARPLDLGLLRRARPAAGQAGLAKLVGAARKAVRDVQVPLLSRERLTLADALRALRAFGQRLRTFTFFSVPVSDWGERTTYFSALLEGVKAGTFGVEQAQAFADIEVRHLGQDETGED